MRSRNLKPGFFKNETLAECQPLARLLFAGLWCAADRRGYLEERPRRLKAELLPYDDCNVEELLEELASRGFILRYQQGRKRYIAITTFSLHQNPHQNEKASDVPAPEQHQSGTGAVAEQSGGFPLTDSLIRNPDSLSGTEQPKPTQLTPSSGAVDGWLTAVCMGVYRKTYQQITPSELAMASGPAKELRGLGVDPGEIHKRCAAWRKHWAHLTISAPALVKNWTQLGELAEQKGEEDGRATAAARREQERADRDKAFEQAGLSGNSSRASRGSAPERAAQG